MNIFYLGEPILISLIEKDDTTLFGIARMRQGDFTFNVRLLLNKVNYSSNNARNLIDKSRRTTNG